MDNHIPPVNDILAELHLAMHKDGRMELTGSLMEKPLCVWMLINAIDYVKAFNPARSSAIPIITPRNGFKH